MKKLLLTSALVPLVFLATACETDKAPAPDSDSSSAYKEGSKIPVDDAVYTIRGTIASDISSLTRQTSAGGASLNSPTCYGTSGCFGGGGGTFFGPVTEGKGYVRLKVQTVSPSTDLAKEGDISVLKVTDTKATALLPGDNVTFKCRRQYEALAAVRDNSTFDQAKLETWELDYCRLATAVIDVPAK